MAKNQIRARYEELRSLAFGSIGATYAAVGTPFVHPVRIIKVFNDTDVNLVISFDGSTNQDISPSGSGHVIDYSANRATNGGQLEQAASETLYIKQESGAASSGSFYVTIIYAS